MRKSVSKRIRVTKNGKLIRRKMAQDHFKSKHPGQRNRHKRKDETVKGLYAQTFSRYLNTKSKITL